MSEKTLLTYGGTPMTTGFLRKDAYCRCCRIRIEEGFRAARCVSEMNGIKRNERFCLACVGWSADKNYH